MLKANEHQEAVALMQWRDTVVGMMPELRCLYHIPNGGDRHVLVGVKLKAEGAMAGVADYHLPVARGGFHSLYIELKAQGGKQSKSQMGFQALVERYGNKYVVCWGWESAVEEIRKYLSEKD